MTGFDGRGPLGRGPMTGRGRGHCGRAPILATTGANIENEPPSQNTEQSSGGQTSVFGLGRGGIPRGCGRGFCRGGSGSARNRMEQMR